jgi:hypothetical protein
MREVLDKVVKRKLGVTDPVIMQGSNLLHESGEDIEEDMVTYYTALLDKVLEQNSLLYMIWGSSLENTLFSKDHFQCN